MSVSYAFILCKVIALLVVVTVPELALKGDVILTLEQERLSSREHLACFERTGDGQQCNIETIQIRCDLICMLFIQSLSSLYAKPYSSMVTPF